MPIRNNRNSRDDKSGKNKRPVNPSKNNHFSSEKPNRTNTSERDLFGEEKSGESKRHSKWSAQKRSGFRNEGGSAKSDNRAERKPFGEKRFSNDNRPFDKSKREGFGERPSDEKRFGERKPYGGKKAYGERKPFEGKKTYREPGFERNENRGSSSANKPFNRERGGTADYRDNRYRSDNRKWTSEEQISPNTRSKKTVIPKDDGLIRLNRYIANAGICSRRKADELIQAGVVFVNGQVVSELGMRVDPAKDEIRYNGATLKREKMVYVLLNKPKDYITTTDDPQERRTVMQLVEKASKERIYPVGRLDRNTTGLLLLTNDGDLADKLSHPKNNITKIYQVELNRNLTQGDLNKIAYGVELEDGLIKPDAISYVQGGSKREIGIQIHSGKNRVVRRIFESFGYEVVKLDRVVYANLTKKDLPRGRWRYLEEKEFIQLKHLMK